ncbi:hypothetical protein FOMPIDRAFT_1044781 [Fomitopsis schrenkii]|uniref:Uncharacterized protein n=1 Tax=Fomitopsis schrenkii TaxID=2126942 RepID=S8G5D4_FOMSC|nr:hypothetical protein FOMPIDRAFT_1044781 [Fomitopsis schrenkii]
MAFAQKVQAVSGKEPRGLVNKAAEQPQARCRSSFNAGPQGQGLHDQLRQYNLRPKCVAATSPGFCVYIAYHKDTASTQGEARYTGSMTDSDPAMHGALRTLNPSGGDSGKAARNARDGISLSDAREQTGKRRNTPTQGLRSRKFMDPEWLTDRRRIQSEKAHHRIPHL